MAAQAPSKKGALRQENTRFKKENIRRNFMKMLGNTGKYSLCFSFRRNGYFLFLNCHAPEKLRFWQQARHAGAGILFVWQACATKHPAKISLYQAYASLSQRA